MNTIHYKVTGMTCSSCIKRVSATLEPFAKKIEITLEPPMVILTEPNSDIGPLNQALAEVGKYKLFTEENYLSHATGRKEATENIPITLSWFKTYHPLLLIFTYILLVTFTVEAAYGNFVLIRWMSHFMASFFIIFSFFKLLDIRGFSSNYAMYDLLAKRLPLYGFIYPFIELALGLTYLVSGQMFFTNLITFLVMSFSSVGVISALLNKQKIRCACLGAIFNLPMSTITVIEDLVMALMALLMLFKH